MLKFRIHTPYLLIFGLPLTVILTAALLAISPLLLADPRLATAITYDLVLTSPLIYFLLIRKRKIPKITVVPFFVVGIVLGSLLLPADQQTHLSFIRTYVLPLVILAVATTVAIKVVQAIRVFRNLPRGEMDFYEAMRKSFMASFGIRRLANMMATEASLFYYAFGTWRRVPKNEEQFTNFKDNGITSLMVGFMFIILVETTVVHILLEQWNATVAWVATILSLYSLVLILGQLKATRMRHSSLTKEHLILKSGIGAQVKVPLNEIEKVELTSREIKLKGKTVAKLGFDAHKVVVYFSQPQTIEKLYGMRSKCDVLQFHIDDKREFVQRLETAIASEK